MALLKQAKPRYQDCILPSFPKLPSSRWPSRGHHFASFRNSTPSKSFILKASLSDPKTCRDANFRPLANFSPSIWKDTFASIPHLQSEIESCVKQVEELKEVVKEMLIAATDDPAENVLLIDTLCRLGVSYQFETEIEQQLIHIFESYANLPDNHDYDLYTIALLFRVLRQHGFKMPCDVFNKFKDENGKFKESLICDVKGMLSLYQATHLSMHGEDILDEALAFTTGHLPSLATNSSPHLAKHICEALEQPFYTGIPRLETLKFIPFYEQDESRNETLLKFSKLDFNKMQILYQQELRLVTSWWNDLNLISEYPYSRDRVVELYFWCVAEYFESRYSRARVMLTKILMILTVMDDTYDAYGTLDELQCFTQAIERWDIEALNELPDYMKSLYIAILNLYDELDDELSKEGRSYGVACTKDTLKELVRAYLVEAQHFREGVVPPFEERLDNAVITACPFFVPAASFIGMGEVAGIDAFDWIRSRPQMLISTCIIGRLRADMVSHEAEQRRGHVASVVEAYMKENGISREETIEKFEIMIDNAWKDVNEGCMRPTAVAMPLVTVILNVARIGEVFYKKVDGITNPQHFKHYIKQLFVDPI
ncbi:Terpene synthase [Melia azedarach]|uniref:Terpene synthase n=1 Tax=Melia azedarach TaxID=155640 RepID=A0ACC1YN64_MELAZ|nr:Terpene synthase [Melia azedarach]